MFLVITGNPVDGFNYYGPFVERIDALEYVSAQYGDVEWWISKLEATNG